MSEVANRSSRIEICLFKLGYDLRSNFIIVIIRNIQFVTNINGGLRMMKEK